MNFNDKYKEYLEYVNGKINDFFVEYADKNVCQDILTAAKYAVNNGGKRIRPILCLSVAESYGLKR